MTFPITFLARKSLLPRIITIQTSIKHPAIRLRYFITLKYVTFYLNGLLALARCAFPIGCHNSWRFGGCFVVEIFVTIHSDHLKEVLLEDLRDCGKEASCLYRSAYAGDNDMTIRKGFVGGESNGTVNVSVKEALEDMNTESLLLESTLEDCLR